MRTRFLPAGLALAGAAAAALVCGCPTPPPAWPARPGLKVLASFAPVYCFAANVVGDAGTVRAVMTTQGPHHFDPRPSDARLVRDADLFFVNGLGLEDRTAATMAKGSGNARLVPIALGDRLDPKTLLRGGCGHDHPGHDHAGHSHDADAPDPHVWMGLDNAVRMVEAIRDEVSKADPGHAADYARRAAEYTARLDRLKAEGAELLKAKTERKFVTFHGSLGYFARTFGLEVAAVVQVVPGTDPTANELNELVKVCVEHKVRVIAVEPQYTTRTSAQRLREELAGKGVADVKLVPIDPLETAPDAALTPAWYEDTMRTNLRELAAALR